MYFRQFVGLPISSECKVVRFTSRVTPPGSHLPQVLEECLLVSACCQNWLGDDGTTQILGRRLIVCAGTLYRV